MSRVVGPGMIVHTSGGSPMGYQPMGVTYVPLQATVQIIDREVGMDFVAVTPWASMETWVCHSNCCDKMELEMRCLHCQIQNLNKLIHNMLETWVCHSNCCAKKMKPEMRCLQCQIQNLN
jgi:hypothetical protein